MLLWTICIFISLIFLFKDTSKFSVKEVAVCIVFAHLIAFVAIVIWFQYSWKLIQHYRGVYGRD